MLDAVHFACHDPGKRRWARLWGGIAALEATVPGLVMAWPGFDRILGGLESALLMPQDYE